MQSLTRLAPRRLISRPLVHRRSIQTSTVLRTSTGYGDPPDEKAANETPTPSSTPDPKQAGKSNTTDPEVGGKKSGRKGQGPGVKAGSATNATGRASKSQDKGKDGEVDAQQIRETKKVGEDPKKEEVGGAGVIGG